MRLILCVVALLLIASGCHACPVAGAFYSQGYSQGYSYAAPPVIQAAAPPLMAPATCDPAPAPALAAPAYAAPALALAPSYGYGTGYGVRAFGVGGYGYSHGSAAFAFRQRAFFTPGFAFTPTFAVRQRAFFTPGFGGVAVVAPGVAVNVGGGVVRQRAFVGPVAPRKQVVRTRQVIRGRR